MKKPDWLTPELEAHANRIWSGALHGFSHVDTMQTSALYDDGTYRILQGGEEKPHMIFVNSIAHSNPDAKEMIHLSAALARVSNQPIKLEYVNDVTETDADVLVTPGDSPQQVQERFDVDAAYHHKMLAGSRGEREAFIAKLQGFGISEVTLAQSMVRGNMAFNVTLAQNYSREELTRIADNMQTMFEQIDGHMSDLQALPLMVLGAAPKHREVSMVGVCPGRSNQLLVHLPDGYTTCVDAFLRMQSEAQRTR